MPGPTSRRARHPAVWGVCGKDSIEAIRVRSAFDVAADPVRVSPAVLARLPDRLRHRMVTEDAPVAASG
jgi:FdhD protein